MALLVEFIFFWPPSMEYLSPENPQKGAFTTKEDKDNQCLLPCRGLNSDHRIAGQPI